MTFIDKLLKRLFPNKIIAYRLSDLIQQSSNQQIENSHICIAIEKDNNTRQFCYLTIDELITLYEHSAAIERSLYELIPPTNQVKAYIDFEYYISNNLAIKNSYNVVNCCLKLFRCLLSIPTNTTHSSNYIDLALKEFLLLEASTSEKVSYHFVHANPSLLFENNVTLGLFIKVLVHFFLLLIVQHKCSSFDINSTLKKYSIFDLITLLSPHLNTLQTRCTECQLYSGYITVAELTHLIVLNKQNQPVLAFDLNVYSKNQQFRLFDCVKKNKINPLVQSNHFPFNNQGNLSYFEVLKKSVVTNIHLINVPIIHFNNNQFIVKSNNDMNSSPTFDHNLINFNNINDHIKNFFMLETNLATVSTLKRSNISRQTITHLSVDVFQQQIQEFTSFVEKIIQSDRLHQGFIRSCVRGNQNTDLLFFNIGGQYRFCPRKGTHHQRNEIAILIDTKNLTYTIRCKDRECNNKFLVWNKIE